MSEQNWRRRYFPLWTFFASVICLNGCSGKSQELAGDYKQQQEVSVADEASGEAGAVKSDTDSEPLKTPLPAKSLPEADKNRWPTSDFVDVTEHEKRNSTFNQEHFRQRWGEIPCYEGNGTWNPGVLSGLPVPTNNIGLRLTDPSVTDLCLGEMKKHAPRIVHLSLCRSKTTNLGARQLKLLKNLQSLDITHTSMDSSVLRNIAEPDKLRYLSLESSITDDFVQDVARLPNLEELEVIAGTVSPGAFTKLASLPGLKLLSIRSEEFSVLHGLAEKNRLHLIPGAKAADGGRAASGSEVVSLSISLTKRDGKDAFKLSLADHFPNLLEVNLRISPLISLPTELLQGLGRLRRLDIGTAEEGPPLRGSSLIPAARITLIPECLKGTTGIEELLLTGDRIDTSALPQLKQLTSLSINAIHTIDSGFMQHVAQCSTLEHFHFEFKVPWPYPRPHNARRGAWGHYSLLAKLPELRSVYIRDLDTKFSTLIGGAALEAFGKLEHLQALQVDPFYLGDARHESGESFGLRFLRSSKALKSTNIEWMLSDQDVKQLVAIKRFHYLRHCTTKMTPHPIGMEDVTWLNLRHSQLTAEGLNAIPIHPALQGINFATFDSSHFNFLREKRLEAKNATYRELVEPAKPGDPIIGLDMSKEKVTRLNIDHQDLLDKGDLTGIEWINFNNCEVDDSIFVFLADIKDLKFVSLFGTKTTLPGLQQFLHYNKNCRVLHDKLQSPLDNSSLRLALQYGILDRTRQLQLAEFDKTTASLLSGHLSKLSKQMSNDKRLPQRKVRISLVLSKVKNVDNDLDAIIPLQNYVFKLDLSGSDLTFAGLRKLQDALTGFERIEVSNTKITRAQVEQFQKSRRRMPYAERRSVIWD